MMAQEAQTVDLSRLYDPRRNKKQMLFHTARETYKLYGGALGGGKTAALINEGLALSLDYAGNFGLLVRKTWPSFRDTVLPQVEKFIPRPLISTWNHTDKLIVLINGSKIRYGGLGDEPDAWEKWMSGEYGWIAIDQAEDFSEKEFCMLATRLRLKLPRIRYSFLLSCNPTLGWLKERFIMRNLPDHRFIAALPEDNLSNLPQGYIERMAEVLDENQRRALLNGDWEAVGEPDNVFSYHKLVAAVKRKATVLEPIEIGVDVARHGDDETVIAIRKGLKAELRACLRGCDLMRTTGEIWRIATSLVKESITKPARLRIKVDADGLGAGVVDRLSEQRREKEGELGLAHIEIVEIHGAAKAQNPARFKNLRAEIHWALRELQDEIELPDDRELLSQLMAIRYRINSAGQYEIIPKEEIKQKTGRSPDRAEAVLYALASLEAAAEPKIWRL